MRSDLTDITLVVDRSGSMQERREDAQGGVNAFIQQQVKEPGEATLTLVQFDAEYEVVHSGVPIEDVPEYELVPRGMTALLDAVGRAINETGKRLSDLKKKARPGLVIFVINTDGLENSSREFSREQIREMIERQQEQYDWHFTYLGANQDAFAEARGMGIHADGVADFSMACVPASYAATSQKVSRMREQRISNRPVSNAFTEEERKKMQ